MTVSCKTLMQEGSRLQHILTLPVTSLILLQHIEGVTHGHSAGHPGNSGQCSVALWRDWTPDFLTSLASQQRSRRHITPHHAAATLGLHPNIPSHGSRYRSGCDGNSPVCTCPITGARPTSVFPPSPGQPVQCAAHQGGDCNAWSAARRWAGHLATLHINVTSCYLSIDYPGV